MLGRRAITLRDIASQFKLLLYTFNADPPSERTEIVTNGDLEFRYTKRISQTSFRGDLTVKINGTECRSVREIETFVNACQECTLADEPKYQSFPQYISDGIRCECFPRIHELYAKAEFDGEWIACDMCNGWFHKQCISSPQRCVANIGANDEWTCRYCEIGIKEYQKDCSRWMDCYVNILLVCKTANIWSVLPSDLTQHIAKLAKPVKANYVLPILQKMKL